MKVTKINPVGNKKYTVYIDDELAFALYKSELNKYHLEEACDISNELYLTIMEEVIRKRAVLRTAHLLEKRDYTEEELVRKLKQAYYPEEAIAYSLNKMKNYGYIDDERYARRYLECYIEKRSINDIRMKLMQKGIKKDIFEAALENVKSDGLFPDEEKQIFEILKKRHYFEHEHDKKEYSKQISYLLSKGYAYQNIVKVLRLDDDTMSFDV